MAEKKAKVFPWFFVRYVHIPISMPRGTLLISYVIENIAFNTCSYHTGRLDGLSFQIFNNQVTWSLWFFIQNTSVYLELHVSHVATVGQSLQLSNNQTQCLSIFTNLSAFLILYIWIHNISCTQHLRVQRIWHYYMHCSLLAPDICRWMIIQNWLH